MKNRAKIELLMKKADEDAYLLDKIIEDINASDEIFGFHAQQAAEKMLKALLLKLDSSFAQTHRIADLIDLVNRKGLAFPERLDELRNLTPFAVIFRYDSLPEENQEPVDRIQIRSLIKELKIWVASSIKK
jgi:HEPN domain-containing protein